MKCSGVPWIGNIPVDWQLVSVKRLFSIGRGRVIAQIELEETGYPVYSSQTKDNGCLGYIDTYDYDYPQLTWTTDGANAGSIFLRTGYYNCTNVCGTLNPTDVLVDLRYQKYALEHIAYNERRIDTNGYKIMNNEMAIIKTLLPPLNVQHQIADYLDTKCAQIDTIIAREQSVIEKLQEYNRAIISEAVTKGINSDREVIDSGVQWIGRIPNSWKIIKLKYEADIRRGRFSHRPRNDPDYYDGKYPFIQTGDITASKKYITSYTQTLNERGLKVSTSFPKDTICMSIAANIGDVAILSFDACFPDSIVGIGSKKIEINYLYYALKNMKERLLSVATISTQQNINVEILNDEFIALPPVDEQKQISNYLDRKSEAIDRIVYQKKYLIDKLNEYKKSLIYEVVTGKKEVPHV